MKLYPPWNREESDSEFFLNELESELHEAHKLHGKKVKFIARVSTSDDVAFELTDGSIAVVHLTYTKESSPNFPWFVLYPSFDNWYQEAVVQSFYDLIGLLEKPTTFEQKLIDLMVGHMSLSDFEFWVYDSNVLEGELGGKLYLELISIRFENKSEISDVLNDWFLNRVSAKGRDLREIAKSLAI